MTYTYPDGPGVESFQVFKLRLAHGNTHFYTPCELSVLVQQEENHYTANYFSLQFHNPFCRKRDLVVHRIPQNIDNESSIIAEFFV